MVRIDIPKYARCLIFGFVERLRAIPMSQTSVSAHPTMIRTTDSMNERETKRIADTIAAIKPATFVHRSRNSMIFNSFFCFCMDLPPEQPWIPVKTRYCLKLV